MRGALNSISDQSETPSWYQIYHDPVLIQQRKDTHLKKLKRLKILEAERGASILDICSGSGEALDILREHQFNSLFGTDIDRRPPLSNPPTHHYVCSNACYLPFRSQSFDWVLCLHSLHHLKSIEAIQLFLGEAIRLLKPHGRLALVDHYDSWQLRLALWFLFKPWFTLTKRLKLFRLQHEQEKEYFYRYLDQWHEIAPIIQSRELKTLLFEKDPFFFYYVGVR